MVPSTEDLWRPHTKSCGEVSLLSSVDHGKHMPTEGYMLAGLFMMLAPARIGLGILTVS